MEPTLATNINMDAPMKTKLTASKLKGMRKTTNLQFVKCQTERINSPFWCLTDIISGLKNHNGLCFKEYFHAYLSIIGQGAKKSIDEIPRILF